MNRGQLKSDVLRLLFLMGLCSAIGVYLILTTSLITKDGVFFIEQARLIAVDAAAVCRRYPPGYPFLIWLSHKVAGLSVERDSPMLWTCSAQAVTLLCRVLTLIPLYLLGRRLVGAATSFWALFVLVILPYPAFYGSDVLREWPYLLFLSTGMLLLHQALTTKRWWLLGLVGLDAGLGYLIRPESAQLILYAVLGLTVLSKGHVAAFREAKPDTQRAGYSLFLLLAGFVVPVIPYVRASGGILPHQMRASRPNTPPVISAVGTCAASDAPLEFEVRVGETLELPIRAADGEDDLLTFSLVGVPWGARPVYLFRSTAAGAGLWTLSEQEKDNLLTTYAEKWDYEGIAWYAYAQPDTRPDLRPIYRFWSPVLGRHFYTMSPSEREETLARSAESWTCEGALLYAFGPENPPADATAVYRVSNGRQECSWTMTEPAESNVQENTIAWFAHSQGQAPAGATLENGFFRWRPVRGQQGDHQVNLLVTDGHVTTCQLLVVHVVDVEPTSREVRAERPQIAGLAGPGNASPILLPIVQHTAFSRAVSAMDELIDGISDDFMIIPVLPWVLGLVHGLRNRATSWERVLILSVLILTTGSVLGRHMVVGPGSARRYCLPMIALTIFYLPAGLDVMTRALNRIYTFRERLAGFGVERRPPWFYLLLLGGVILCTPKLISTPLRADKAGYRAAGEWLRANTPAGAVIADPDRRICFYADRPGLLYEQYPNWRKADFVVVVAGNDSTQAPQGWTQVHSVAAGEDNDAKLVIFRGPY